MYDINEIQSYLQYYIQQMRKLRQDMPTIELQQLKQNQALYDYINNLRTQIRSLGTQIDYEFQKFSECTFSIYKHFYSSSECSGEKANFLNKLNNSGIQWNLQSQFELKSEEPQQRVEQTKTVNAIPVEQRQYDINKKGYNIRVKTKPLKYKNYGDEQMEVIEKFSQYREEAPRRGRPVAKRDSELQQKRFDPPSNPYQKAPYKKRKHYNQLNQDQHYKEQSPLKEQNGRHSVQDEKQAQIIVQIIKNSQQEVKIQELERNEVQVVSERHFYNDEEKHKGTSNVLIQEAQRQYKLIDILPISEVVENYRNCLKNMKLFITLENDQS